MLVLCLDIDSINSFLKVTIEDTERPSPYYHSSKSFCSRKNDEKILGQALKVGNFILTVKNPQVRFFF